MRQFALLATFAVVLFWGAAALATRPLPLEPSLIFAILGALIFLLAVILAYFLAHGLTDSLRGLSQRVTELKPDHWGFERSIFSGDEVELLDRVIADMAHRLQRSYGEMEREIHLRTRELREQYLRDRTILTSIHHGVIVTDSEGIVTDTNPAAVEMMGRNRTEEVCGRPVADVLPLSHHHCLLSPEQHPIMLCLRSHAEVHPSPQRQLSLERPNYSRVPVMLLVSPLLSGSTLLGAVAVFHDVTEERRLDYLKSEFVSLASHQLRTPLSMISWYLELLKTDDREKLTATQQAYVAEMSAASQRMARLIDALLRVSALEGGGVAPVEQEVDLAALLRDVTEDERSLAKERKISMELSLPTRLVITTDPTLLQIVLHNILSNAVKYSEAGDTVRVSLAEEGQKAIVSVQDTGIGIPAGEQKYLFTRLFRASNATKMDTTGSGLGLYISRIIVEQLKGHMTFQSRENEGTTFVLELPLSMWKKPDGATTEASPS